MLICDIPGPIKSGSKQSLSIDFDTRSLIGGMKSVRWNLVEVYSTADSNEKNNRGD
jgi:hypothetical protein